MKKKVKLLIDVSLMSISNELVPLSSLVVSEYLMNYSDLVNAGAIKLVTVDTAKKADAIKNGMS